MTVRHLPIADLSAAKPLLERESRAIDRARRPIYAVWEVTLACDLACKHCGSRAGAARPDELSTEAALALVDSLADLGVKSVTLIGGEAYLRPDWLELIRSIRARGMGATMTTGGRGVTAVVAREAKAAGLEAVSVSVDGLRETHDGLRGRGSHDAARRAIDHLRTAGVDVGVNTQVNRQNLAELEEVFDFIAREGAYAWQVALTVAMGRAADRPELLLQPYHLDDLFPRLASLAQRAQKSRIRLTRGNNVGYFGPFEEQFHFGSARDYAAGCPAGRLVIGIEADGTVKGCPSLPTQRWSAGTVAERDLKTIWERGTTLQRLRDKPTLWGYCATCYYASECGGGCTWTADATLGRPGNNPYCHHRVLELKKTGQRERLVHVETAPGHPFDRGRFEIVLEPWLSETPD